MLNQTELDFTQPPVQAAEIYGQPALNRMVDTSKAKLEALDAKMTELQRRIMAHLFNHFHGLGPCQVAEDLGFSILSVRPCMTMLKRKGLIWDTGNRRYIGKSQEAIMTCYIDAADPKLVDVGMLGRTGAAYGEGYSQALHDLKKWIAQTNQGKHQWWLTGCGQEIVAEIDRRLTTESPTS